jgi:hypothetical protein
MRDNKISVLCWGKKNIIYGGCLNHFKKQELQMFRQKFGCNEQTSSRLIALLLAREIATYRPEKVVANCNKEIQKCCAGKLGIEYGSTNDSSDLPNI